MAQIAATVLNWFIGRPGRASAPRAAHFQVRAKLSPRLDTFIGITGIATVLAIWALLTYSGFVKPAFLPTPTGMWEGMLDFHKKQWLIPAIGRSFWRVTQSLLLVMLIGIPFGVLIGSFTWLDSFSRKIVNGAKSVPTTGIVGLIVLWFGIEERGKVVFLFIGAIFYMIILVKSAILSVSDDYVRVALDLGGDRWQIITRVLVPGGLPQIWDAIAVCNGIMWTYIVLAEFINASEEQLGLGYLLYIGSRTSESGKVFATLAIIAIISSMSDWILQTVRRRFLNW